MMDINELRRIIKQESPTRLELGIVTAADNSGIRNATVRLSGGMSATRIYMVPESLDVGDRVIVARMDGLDRMVVIGRILNEYETNLSRSSVLTPAPPSFTVTGIPMGVEARWDSTPGRMLYYEVQRAPDSGGNPDTANLESVLITRGSYYRHLCTVHDNHSVETWHFRTRSLYWIGNNNVMYSAWNDWEHATSLTWDGRYYSEDEISSHAVGEGASLVWIADVDGNFDADVSNVELALAGLVSGTAGVSGPWGNVVVVATTGALYSTVQGGLNAANSGDTVFVMTGSYGENVTQSTANMSMVGLGNRRNTGPYGSRISGADDVGPMVDWNGDGVLDSILLNRNLTGGSGTFVGIDADGACANIINCRIHIDPGSTGRAISAIRAGAGGACVVNNCWILNTSDIILTGNVMMIEGSMTGTIECESASTLVLISSYIDGDLTGVAGSTLTLQDTHVTGTISGWDSITYRDQRSIGGEALSTTPPTEGQVLTWMLDAAGCPGTPGVSEFWVPSELSILSDQSVGEVLSGPLSGEDDTPTYKHLSHVGVAAGFGESLFTKDDGLLLLGPGCPISSTEWRTLRGQAATLSGAFHQEAGRWPGTRGLVVEEETTNLYTNPSAETNTTGWAGTSATLTRSSEQARFGDYSFKLVSTINGTFGLYDTTEPKANPGQGETYTVAFWVYAPAAIIGKTIQVTVREKGGATGTEQTTTNHTLGWGWQRVAGSHTILQNDRTAADAVLGVNAGIIGDVLYADGCQFEEKAYPTTTAIGGMGSGYTTTDPCTRTATEVNLDAQVGLISGKNTLSFSMWVQMPYDADATWPTYARLFGARGADDANRTYLRYLMSSDKFQVVINGYADLESAVQTFDAGDWIHVVVTLDYTSDNYNLYIAGVLEDSSTTARTAPTLTDWCVGADYNGGNIGNFVVDEFAVLNRVLTAEEIAAIYASNAPLVDGGALTPPVINYHDDISHTKDLFWVGAGSGVPYGAMYQTATGFNVTLTTLNTWYELDAATTNISAGQLNLVTFPGDHYLQVNKAGKYRVEWSCTAQINAASQGVEFGVMVNGTIQLPGRARTMFLNVGRNLNISSTAILDLAANDQISLGARNITSGSDILSVSFLNASVTMVGG